jgi:hypothetical protein
MTSNACWLLHLQAVKLVARRRLFSLLLCITITLRLFSESNNSHFPHPTAGIPLGMNELQIQIQIAPNTCSLATTGV